MIRIACPAFGLLVLTGCPSGEPAPVRSRVDAVTSAPVDRGRVEAFCEVLSAAGAAPPFQPPAMEGTLPDDPGWTWVSLWATWCVPCIEELPLMRQWVERMEKAGDPVALRFISVDARVEDLSGFRSRRPDAPDGPRLQSQEDLGPWLASLGVDGAASIPIHLFVDPQDRVRCVRVGGVSAHDEPTVRHLLAGG